MKTTLTQEEMDSLFNEYYTSPNEKMDELLNIYFNYVNQSEHVFAFNMYYADPRVGMYGSDLVREYGVEALEFSFQPPEGKIF